MGNTGGHARRAQGVLNREDSRYQPSLLKGHCIEVVDSEGSRRLTHWTAPFDPLRSCQDGLAMICR